jgi:serine/threonine protein phosphatase 1
MTNISTTLSLAHADRCFVFGDIHGCLTALEVIWHHIQPTMRDRVICLGDYIDRGPDSKGVIDFLIDAQTQTQLTCLLGNHEQMLLDCDADPELWTYWCKYGGQIALASYDYDEVPVEIGLDFLPASHRAFLQQLLPYAESERYLFSHACPVMNKALGDHDINELRWARNISTQPHQSGKTAIFGHMSQQSGRVLCAGPHRCVDTSMSGWISCLELGRQQVHQGNQWGQYRTDHLA